MSRWCSLGWHRWDDSARLEWQMHLAPGDGQGGTIMLEVKACTRCRRLHPGAAQQVAELQRYIPRVNALDPSSPRIQPTLVFPSTTANPRKE